MKIHLIGVAGTGMGAFAGLLKQAGHDVRGSDENVYPPMSDKLADWGIEALTPYAARNLEPAPDLVVVGNVVRKENPEAVAVRERGLKHASFPATLGELFLKDRHSVVVAGTHGKTTTTTLIAWILLDAGKDPGLLVGGVPADNDRLRESFRLGAADAPFVVEGDEYDTAYFDKGPKFLHYRPRTLLCTSLEYDHADIYDSVDAIIARFTEVLRLVPKDGPSAGHIVVCAEERHLQTALDAAGATARVTRYGEGGDVVARDVREDEHGTAFSVVDKGVVMGSLFVPLSGRHSLLNALGAYAVLGPSGLGLSFEEIARGMESFPGVRRRLEERGEASGVLVVDDFAHHPTAVLTTLEGAKKKWAGRPLWALFEPRSATSCRKIFQADYARAFSPADVTLLAPPGRALDPAIALDVPLLAKDIAATGKVAQALPSIDALVDAVVKDAPRGAVVLCMSNGGFGGIHDKLLTALKARP